MNTRIVENQVYHGETAVVIENGTVRAVVLPGRGAKVASLCLGDSRQPLADAPGTDSGTPSRWTEVLSQIDADCYQVPLEYGREFQGEDGSGFDDMAATIDACQIQGATGSPDEAGGLIQLPDHGEAWSRPWLYSLDGESIVLSIDGKALPYRFMKKISLRENELLIDYSVENRASVRIPFQWAAHALFRISPGARLEVPVDMSSIHNVCPGSTLPEAGGVYDYPRPFGPDGVDISRMPPKNSCGAQKYWFAEAVTEGRCAITVPELGVRSSVLFDPADLPWLGIWVNEGGWHDGYNLGIEPSTCWLDSPAAAMKHGRCLFLGPGERLSWPLRIKLDTV